MPQDFVREAGHWSIANDEHIHVFYRTKVPVQNKIAANGVRWDYRRNKQQLHCELRRSS